MNTRLRRKCQTKTYEHLVDYWETVDPLDDTEAVDDTAGLTGNKPIDEDHFSISVDTLGD